MRRRWLVGLVLTLVLLVALGGWWLVTVIRRLDHELVDRFSGRRWEIPSKVYSDSFTVYAGTELSPLKLVERLERLDYRRVEGEPAHAGEYTYRPAARELEVF